MADFILVDSDVVIEGLRGKTEATLCLKQIEQQSVLSISVISTMELLVGCRNKAELQTLDKFLTRFQVISLDEEISHTAVDLLHRYNLSHGLLIADALIASTAISRKISLVSRNARDYRFITALDLLPYPQPFKT